MDTKESFLVCISNADRTEARRLMEDWALLHGPCSMISDFLEPCLRRIGEEWLNKRSFTLAQAYVAAKLAEDALELVEGSVVETARVSSPKGAVVIGNIEEDFHPLGRRMVGVFLRINGWQVHDLGCDVPAPVFVEKALATGARVIGASAMMLSTAMHIRGVREELDRRGLGSQIKLAVGGAVFVVRPELVHEVGGDGTATNAILSVELFKRLWDAASPAGAHL